MTELKVYDSKTQRKNIFIPINPKKIGIYVCGITVYDDCHIGHARTFIAFDVIVRYLKHKFGVENVVFVRNITDIDDKIIKRAQENNETCEALTARYIQSMRDDAASLGLISPDIEPKATEFMPQMISLIKLLISKNYAYQVDDTGDVFYKVRAFGNYGSLSKRNIDDAIAGARVDVNEEKLDPLDFVLWKMAKPGEPAWDSPWGKGRPGWHIECSAMAMELLGLTIDLHGGGADLLFPHHENECAQSEACSGQEFVKNWLHVGFLQINKEKMAKSLNNFVTIKQVLKDVHAEELRLFMLYGHYRSQLDYSLDQVKLARSSLDRLYTAMSDIEITDKIPATKNTDFEQKFIAAMDDDFNTPAAMAVLFELATEINTAKKAEPKVATGLIVLLKQLGSLLGLLQRKPSEALGIIDKSSSDQHIQDLINARDKARQEKNWAEADRLRAELTGLGVSLEDTGKGATKVRKS